MFKGLHGPNEGHVLGSPTQELPDREGLLQPAPEVALLPQEQRFQQNKKRSREFQISGSTQSCYRSEILNLSCMCNQYFDLAYWYLIYKDAVLKFVFENRFPYAVAALNINVIATLWDMELDKPSQCEHQNHPTAYLDQGLYQVL